MSSHAEIWDDSALINSWNGALEEYQHYHSIHAKGEKVEEAIKLHENGDDSADADVKDKASEQVATEGIDAEPIAYTTGHAQTVNMDPQITQTKGKLLNVDPTVAAEAGNGQPIIGPAVPQHLIGAVHDEGLKNLLMSWYYAGYYTGLYEGRQLAKPDGPQK